MIILIVGGGGREHALAWKCAQSPQIDRVLVAPGNAGTAMEARCENVDVAAEDVDGLLALAEARDAGLTIVGPEAPLVAGIVDRFETAGRRIFGPRAEAARLEGSKAYSKAFLTRHGIPTAEYREFADAGEAERYLKGHRVPVVVKADGLAAGKGVTVAHTVEDAVAAARACLEGGAHGEAGRRVVVEEFLAGEEVSFICIVGGGRVLPMASSQDHKARDDGDRGPNTGGMGAYSPAPRVDATLHRRIMEQVIEPTVRGLAADGIDYTGFLYAGLMVGADGEPRVLEYNCRLGDPETQPVLMRLESDLVALVGSALDGSLPADAAWDRRAALGVVLAAGGYPLDYRKGDAISGLDDVQPDTKVFHAGTRRDGEQVLTSGGRVLCVCALGDDVAEAQARAYDRVGRIAWRDVYYRSDIGHRALGHVVSRAR